MASVPRKCGKEDSYRTGCECHPRKASSESSGVCPYFSPMTMKTQASGKSCSWTHNITVPFADWTAWSFRQYKWSGDRSLGLGGWGLRCWSCYSMPHGQNQAAESENAMDKESAQQNWTNSIDHQASSPRKAGDYMASVGVKASQRDIPAVWCLAPVAMQLVLSGFLPPHEEQELWYCTRVSCRRGRRWSRMIALENPRECKKDICSCSDSSLFPLCKTISDCAFWNARDNTRSATHRGMLSS